MLSILAGIVSVFGELLVLDYHPSNRSIESHEETSKHNKLHTNESHPENLVPLHNTDLHSSLNQVTRHSITADTSETMEHISAAMPAEATTGIKRRFSIKNLDETETDLSISAAAEPLISIVDTPRSSPGCAFITAADSRIINDQLHQVDYPSSIEKKNKSDQNNNNDEATPDKTSETKPPALKRKKYLQKEFNPIKRRCKTSRIHQSDYCITQLFHPKSIVHIHDGKNRMFSIASRPTPQNDAELLTQRTEECVDQIFDLMMMHNTFLHNTNRSYNQECQAELRVPLYTKSQLLQMQTASNYLNINKFRTLFDFQL